MIASRILVMPVKIRTLPPGGETDEGHMSGGGRNKITRFRTMACCILLYLVIQHTLDIEQSRVLSVDRILEKFKIAH